MICLLACLLACLWPVCLFVSLGHPCRFEPAGLPRARDARMDTAATAPSWGSRTRRVLKARVRKGTYGTCGYKGYPIRYSRMRAAGRLRAAARARTAARGTPALTYCSHLTVAARMHRPNPNRPERLIAARGWLPAGRAGGGACAVWRDAVVWAVCVDPHGDFAHSDPKVGPTSLVTHAVYMLAWGWVGVRVYACACVHEFSCARACVFVDACVHVSV